MVDFQWSSKKRTSRIDEMFSNVGLDNQAKVRKDGSGYYWCVGFNNLVERTGLETPSGGQVVIIG